MSDLIDRQDAIDAIDRFNVCGYVEEPWEKLRDVLQTLPSAQPEPCEDAVSRQDAIKLACYTSCRLVASNTKYFVTCLDQGATPCEGIKLLMELPSVQPEPKKGHWIPVTRIEEWGEIKTDLPMDIHVFPDLKIRWKKATSSSEVDAVMCSECGEVFDFQDARNWCTECGADMRGEVE